MRVGLTGGIASGKSTVSKILAELGAVVIDADQLAREVVAGGTPGLAAVVEAFGPGVLTPAGELDRPALGAIVFADPEKRRTLEAIVVHDIPLLAETGQAGTFDAVIVVDAPEETQVARMLADRGWTEGDARARIGAQATREQRLAVATHVIENTGTLEDLRRRVAEVFEELLAGG